MREMTKKQLDALKRPTYTRDDTGSSIVRMWRVYYNIECMFLSLMASLNSKHCSKHFNTVNYVVKITTRTNSN